MSNKSKNRWLDVQIILASLAVTSTLALWNLFVKGSCPVASSIDNPNPDPTSTFVFTPNPTATAYPTATATLDPLAPIHLPKVHILLGGSLPIPVAAQPPASASGKPASASKSSASSSNPAPAPVASTSSSKP
ncbi:MAG: hypothetical protein ABSA23_16150 [Anaerolineales bacterium]